MSFNDSPKLSGWVDTLINVGAQIYAASQTAGGATGQARGLAAIRAAGNQVIAAFDSLLVAYAAMPYAERRATANEALAKGQELVSALSNPQIFYQPKSGNDKTELNTFKATANLKFNQLQGLVNEANTGTTAGTTPTTNTTPTVTQQTVTNPDGTKTVVYVQSETSGGLSTNELMLYGGVALVAVLLLTRK